MKFLDKENINSNSDWVQDKGYKRKILVEDKVGKSSIQLNVVDPRTTIPTHFHKTLVESVYVLSGEATLLINQKEYPMKSGDIITIEPIEIHTVKNNSEDEFRYLVFKANVQADDKFFP